MKFDTYNAELLNKAFSEEETLTFDENISTEELLRIFGEILEIESKDENNEKQFKFDLKNMDASRLTALFKFWMSQNILEKVRNSTIILNIIILLKTYNTFDNDFFTHPLIFISSIDKFLDVKLDVQKEIQEINCQIGTYFISLVKSLSKTEYTMLDSYVDMPYFFKSIFVSIDMVTISGILSTIPEDFQYKTCFVRDANKYMTLLARNYVMSDDMISEFIGKNTTTGD